MDPFNSPDLKSPNIKILDYSFLAEDRDASRNPFISTDAYHELRAPQPYHRPDTLPAKTPKICLIVLNQPIEDACSDELFSHLWESASLRIAADGAATRLWKHSLKTANISTASDQPIVSPPFICNPGKFSENAKEYSMMTLTEENEAASVAAYVQQCQFTPDVVVGDLDSIPHHLLTAYAQKGSDVCYSTCQDTMDLQKALVYSICYEITRSIDRNIQRNLHRASQDTPSEDKLEAPPCGFSSTPFLSLLSSLASLSAQGSSDLLSTLPDFLQKRFTRQPDLTHDLIEQICETCKTFFSLTSNLRNQVRVPETEVKTRRPVLERDVMTNKTQSEEFTGFDLVICLGAFGGRFDQEMAAIQSCFSPGILCSRVVLIGQGNVGELLSPGLSLLIPPRDESVGNVPLTFSTRSKTTQPLNPGLVLEPSSSSLLPFSNRTYCGLLPIGCAISRVTTVGLEWNLGTKEAQTQLLNTVSAISKWAVCASKSGGDDTLPTQDSEVRCVLEQNSKHGSFMRFGGLVSTNNRFDLINVDNLSIISIALSHPAFFSFTFPNTYDNVS